jgi:hypothetical protein
MIYRCLRLFLIIYWVGGGQYQLSKGIGLYQSLVEFIKYLWISDSNIFKRDKSWRCSWDHFPIGCLKALFPHILCPNVDWPSICAYNFAHQDLWLDNGSHI